MWAEGLLRVHVWVGVDRRAGAGANCYPHAGVSPRTSAAGRYGKKQVGR